MKRYQGLRLVFGPKGRPVAQRAGRLSPRFNRLLFALAVVFQTVAAAPAPAETLHRSTPAPQGLPGLTGGALMPNRSMRFSIGALQTPHKTNEGQTGRQLYIADLSYRHDGPWQTGLTLTGFDDLPAAPLQGRDDDVTDVGLSAQLRYQFHDMARFDASFEAGLAAHYFSRGQKLRQQNRVSGSDRDLFVTGTLALAASFAHSAQLWSYSEIGFSHLPHVVAGAKGFGGRRFLGAGLAFQPHQRFIGFASVKALWRRIDGSIDAPSPGDGAALYTIGARLGLTERAAVDLYAGNAYNPGPLGDDLLFFPDKTEPALGVVFRLSSAERSSQRGPLPRSATVGHGLMDPGGVNLDGWGRVAAGQYGSSLSWGPDGPARLAFTYAPEADLQIGASLQEYALDHNTGFRDEGLEDWRGTLALRWQAMRMSQSQPADLAMTLALSRDIADPSIGVSFMEAHAERLWAGNRLRVNARRAVFGADFGDKPEVHRLSGIGAGIERALSQSVSIMAEYTSVQPGPPVWALAIRQAFPDTGSGLDLAITNAAGLDGVGTLVANQSARITLQWHWAFAQP